MKIINKTEWRTADLRKLITTAIKDVGKPEKHLIIIVVYARGNHYSGRASLYMKRFKVRIPKPEYTKEGKLDNRCFAWVTAHEYLHTCGQRHSDMGATFYNRLQRYYKENDRLAFVDHIEIRRKEVKQKSKTDIKIKRYFTYLDKLKQWQSKLKRAHKRIKHYEKKIKRYEKQYAYSPEMKKQKGGM